jgi:hypothetical protein
MPWVRRTHESHRFFWIIAGIAGVALGVLSGYSWWGDSAALVTVVERQLGQSQAQVRMLEKRLKTIETRLGIDGAAEVSASATSY